jgi:hypothetical protein
MSTAKTTGYFALAPSLVAGMPRLAMRCAVGDAVFLRASLDCVFRNLMLASRRAAGSSALASLLTPFKGLTMQRALLDALIPCVVRDTPPTQLPRMVVRLYAMAMHLGVIRWKELKTAATVAIQYTAAEGVTPSPGSKRMLPTSAALVNLSVSHGSQGGWIVGGAGDSVHPDDVWFQAERLCVLRAYLQASGANTLGDSRPEEISMEEFVKERTTEWFAAATHRMQSSSKAVSRKRQRAAGTSGVPLDRNGSARSRKYVGPDVDFMCPFIVALLGFCRGRGVDQAAAKELFAAILHRGLSTVGDDGANGVMRHGSGLWTNGSAKLLRLLPPSLEESARHKAVLDDWNAFYRHCASVDSSLREGSEAFNSFLSARKMRAAGLLDLVIGHQWSAIVENPGAAAGWHHTWLVEYERAGGTPLSEYADAFAGNAGAGTAHNSGVSGPDGAGGPPEGDGGPGGIPGSRQQHMRRSRANRPTADVSDPSLSGGPRTDSDLT